MADPITGKYLIDTRGIPELNKLVIKRGIQTGCHEPLATALNYKAIIVDFEDCWIYEYDSEE